MNTFFTPDCNTSSLITPQLGAGAGAGAGVGSSSGVTRRRYSAVLEAALRLADVNAIEGEGAGEGELGQLSTNLDAASSPSHSHAGGGGVGGTSRIDFARADSYMESMLGGKDKGGVDICVMRKTSGLNAATVDNSTVAAPDPPRGVGVGMRRNASFADRGVWSLPLFANTSGNAADGGWGGQGAAGEGGLSGPSKEQTDGTGSPPSTRQRERERERDSGHGHHRSGAGAGAGTGTHHSAFRSGRLPDFDENRPEEVVVSVDLGLDLALGLDEMLGLDLSTEPLGGGGRGGLPRARDRARRGGKSHSERTI